MKGQSAEGREVKGQPTEGREVKGQPAEGSEVKGQPAEGREMSRLPSYSSFLLAICFCVFLFSCTDRDQSAVAQVPRDTTITVENSYTKIFIDSMLVEQFIVDEKINDSTAQRIRNFYNKRNYSYAWFSDTGITVQAQAFWSVHDDHLENLGDSSLYKGELHAVMDTLIKTDSVRLVRPAVLARTEMLLTAHFFDFVKLAYGAKADPEIMQWNIPVRRLNIDALLDSLLAHNNSDQWRPLNRYFYRMQNAIFNYRRIQQNGGWDSLPITRKKIRAGEKDELVKALRRRLSVVGMLPATDTSDLFDDSLAVQVEKLKLSFGLPGDKVIDSALVKELNVSLDTRLKQMLVNLERFKWLPNEPNRFIFVNIPDYTLYVNENGQPVMKMKVVVGKAVNRTVIFSGDLKYVVFSPYWNIPPSIVRNEVLPAMNRSASYLDRNNYEITGYAGGLPVIRQKPGPDNALGLVKFLFPNEYNIYLHDTNAKSLFERNDRAFSHGCIRINRPFDLARYLLQEDTSWTDKKMRAAMNEKKEKWVTLEDPIKVYILYITSWVGNDGTLNFRKDIYGHDRKMVREIFR